MVRIIRSGDKGYTEKFAIDKKALKFLWQYAHPYKLDLGRAFITSVPLAAMGGLLAWSSKQITQGFTQKTTPGEIFFWIGVAFTAGIIRSGFSVINKLILTTFHARQAHDIRLDIHDRIHENSLDFHNHTRTGELANLVYDDVQCAAAGIIQIYSALWQHPANMLFLIGLMLYLNPFLSLILICMLPILGICVSLISRLSRNAELRFMEQRGLILGILVESMTNVKQVKCFDLKNRQRDKLSEEGERLIIYRKKAALLTSLISPATEILVCTVIGIMAVIAYYQIQNGTTSAGSIVGCLTATLGLLKPIKALSQSVVELQRSFAAVRRIEWAAEQSKNQIKRYSINSSVHRILLENVAFTFDGRRNVLKGINMEIHKGERIAVIGPSGAGKTTLLDLIAGFYPCSSGRIVIDGKVLSDVDLGSWRQQIGIVSQEPFLFDATIEENISFGNHLADSIDIQQAARQAGCDEMLSRLPDGILTRIGERGCLLSGGERKRIALARALVRPISFLILDEATSELDLKTEEKLLQVIDSISSHMIVLHVSHRQSILKHCDRTFLLENGKIKETDRDETMSSLSRKKYSKGEDYPEQLLQLCPEINR